MPGELPSSVIAEISFVGRAGGTVKTLRGFRKSHHTIPDAANAVTNGFLGKICDGELGEGAEKLFQDVRAGLGYKRKDISLGISSPLATLTTKDFVVEIVYALEESEPSRYAVTTTLLEVRSADLVRTEDFSRIFAGRFSEIVFALKKGVQVETVIDAIENLAGAGGLTVHYPSDYRDCLIRVEGVDAEVRCTAGSLGIVFARPGTPAELVEAFVAVREAFQISKALAALIE